MGVFKRCKYKFVDYVQLTIAYLITVTVLFYCVFVCLSYNVLMCCFMGPAA